MLLYAGAFHCFTKINPHVELQKKSSVKTKLSRGNQESTECTASATKYCAVTAHGCGCTNFPPPMEAELHLPSAHLRSGLGLGSCRIALQAPACCLAAAGIIVMQWACSPLLWEEQAVSVLSTQPRRAAAFIPHLDLVTEEIKHCKYILKTRLVNTARNDYCL